VIDSRVSNKSLEYFKSLLPTSKFWLPLHFGRISAGGFATFVRLQRIFFDQINYFRGNFYWLLTGFGFCCFNRHCHLIFRSVLVYFIDWVRCRTEPVATLQKGHLFIAFSPTRRTCCEFQVILIRTTKKSLLGSLSGHQRYSSRNWSFAIWIFLSLSLLPSIKTGERFGDWSYLDLLFVYQSYISLWIWYYKNLLSINHSDWSCIKKTRSDLPASNCNTSNICLLIYMRHFGLLWNEIQRASFLVPSSTSCPIHRSSVRELHATQELNWRAKH